MPQQSTQSGTTTDKVRQEFKSLGEELKGIGKDIQAKIDQAGDETKETWRKLKAEQARFGEKADQAAEETREDLRQMGSDLKRRFQSLRDELASSSKDEEKKGSKS